MVMSALVYHIWRVRNDVLWNSKVWLVDNTIHRILTDCHMRINFVIPKKMKGQEEELIKRICTKE